MKLNFPYLKDKKDASTTGEIDAIKVFNLIASNIAFSEETIKEGEETF